MSRINSNVSAIRAINQLGRNQADLNLRLERLATGLRINRGADDPAGLIASERLRSEMASLKQAVANSTRAANVVMTAEGALSEVSSLLLDLQGLIVNSANEAGLSKQEVQANQLQIDSILTSINRISNTTTFAGRKLIDGSESYLVSGVPANAVASLSIYSAQIRRDTPYDVTVQVTQSAQTAHVALIGAGGGSGSTTSATTVEIHGNVGSELLSFVSGTSLSEIRAAINNVAAATGVSAVISSVAVGVGASALILNSTQFGSNAFVSVEPLSGNFVSNNNAGTTLRAAGRDVHVLVNGQQSSGAGLRADVHAPTLDLSLFLTKDFAQTLSSATFTITGGGTLYQVSPEINPNGQVHLGMNSVSTTSLGNSVVGLLFSLQSGYGNSLETGNFDHAQQIVNEAISQVASYRGRLGSIQRNELEVSIAVNNVALENVTASESSIRDADFAAETAALTRAQILVQSTQATLQIANSIPKQVLALLQ
ncbi:MAG: flagellin [Planctomycetes bacterium]|nr:flagellin [Planctomycetota bacterium]MBI3833042.1 flagellin [Planctomycetota bacterium]